MKRAALLLVPIAAAMLLAASPQAAAHALLASSDPADGVSLKAAPSAVSLTFTEDPDPRLSRIEVLDASGATHQRGPVEASSADPRTLRASVAHLRVGVYTVSWRVVSRADGHLTAGAFAFGISVDPSRIEPANVDVSTPPLSPLEPAGRFAFYAGVVLVVGAAWVTAFAFETPPAASTRLLAAGIAVAAAGLVALATAQVRASGASIATVVSTPVGRAIVGRAVFLIAALLAIVLGPRWARRPLLVTTIAAAGGAMSFHVATGHAAATRSAVVEVALQLMHFGAVAVWIGGLAALLVGIGGLSVDQRGRAIRRFSIVAGVCLAVVVGTGTARALDEVGSWHGLFSTGYGRVVIAKVAGVAALAALGARNRWWNVPEVERSVTGFRRVSRGELAIAVVVLLLTGTLSSLVPARTAALAQATTRITLEGTDFARTVKVYLEITPGHPGANRFEAKIEPLTGNHRVDGLRIRLASADAGIGESTLTLHARGDLWEARAANTGVAGLWRAVVLVERGADSAEVAFEFHTRCRTQDAPTPGQPTIHTIELGSGRQAQGYVDPGRAGTNDVHFTFFDARDDELPLHGSATIVAIRDGQSSALDVRRFSSGHFVGSGKLRAGGYVFEIRTETTRGREPLTACFEEDVS